MRWFLGPKMMKLLSKSIYNSPCRLFSSQNVSHIIQNSKPGDNIEIKGWIRALRKQKENIFLDITDGSTEKKLQIIVPSKLGIKDLNTGSSIQAVGKLTLSPKGVIELTAEKLDIIGNCVVTEGYPFAPRKQYTPEYIRQYLHFRPRTNKFSSLLRVRNAATLNFHNYLNQEGFVNIHTPVLTSNDCEGAGEVFKVVPENSELINSMIKEKQPIDEAYFNTKAFLTVSGQMHLEAAAHGLSKVYTFGPTFRAENSRSRLHLSEFYMLESEIAFIDDIKHLIIHIEAMLKNVTKNILNNYLDDIEKCNGEINPDFSWLDKSFSILTYDEAVKILEINNDKFKEKFTKADGDIGKEHERFLCHHCGDIPTFVINWPKNMKPFYMKELGEDRTKVAALDLLAPNVGEILGGSLRENNYEILKQNIPKIKNQLDWYLEIRKFGGVPTAGYGLGFERYLQFILGISNIKDTIPFPRWPHNCSM